MHRNLLLVIMIAGCALDEVHGMASSEIGVPPECVVDCSPQRPMFARVANIAPTSGYGTGNLLLAGNALIFQGTQMAVWTVPLEVDVGDVLGKLRVSIKGNASEVLEVHISGRNARDNTTVVPRRSGGGTTISTSPTRRWAKGSGGRSRSSARAIASRSVASR